MKKGRASGKGIVLRYSEGSELLDGLAVRAIPFISKAAPLVSRVEAALATGAVTALGSLGVEKLLGGAVYIPKGPPIGPPTLSNINTTSTTIDVPQRGSGVVRSKEVGLYRYVTS